MIDNRANALLSYDGINKRLYLYVAGEGITSYYLDGSDSTTKSLSNVAVFAVDGKRNVIYYYHGLTSRIEMYNITDGEKSVVVGLSGISGVKDLEVDPTNRLKILIFFLFETKFLGAFNNFVIVYVIFYLSHSLCYG